MNAPTTPPSTSSALHAARRLAPQIREAAGEIEATRELPRPLFEAIADAGLFHMCVPRALGGLEIDFPQQVLVAEELGKADASTAWAVNQGATFASWSMYLPPSTVREIWIDTPRCVVSNTPEPNGKAIVVPGGYRVSGRHGFSTGCMHASWVASQAQIIDNGVVRQHNGAPELRFFFMPKSEVQVLDTWNTRGMRGTGTHHFELKDVFVPDERSCYTRGAPRVTDGTRYRIPTTLIFLGGDAAVALAVARSCIDTFCELAGGKSPRHMTGLLRDQPVAQYNVGQCEALLRSARALLMETVGDLWDGASRNGELTLEQRANMRLAGTHAIRTAVKVVESIYADCGATAIFEGNLLHRLFQDIHVITQHLQSRRGFYEMIGKFQMGLPIDEARL
jgi:alkylation response protein AidB-like acyl-CoA dehydrogenase